MLRSSSAERNIGTNYTCTYKPKQPALANPAALTFLTMTMKPSFRAEFKAGEGGKTAVYMARWVNTRGEKGPWSEITTATVAA